MALMVGIAVAALWAVSGNRGHSQADNPNAAPNPYKMQDNWLQLPEGRKLGQAIKVQVDHSDGKSIWVFDRCSANSCANSTVAPIMKFDSTGKQTATWGKHGKGQGEFDQLHGIAMDSQGRIFVADRGNSRVQVFDSNGKFVAEWKQFGRPSDVSIDKNDVIYVADDQSNESRNPGFKTGIRIGSGKDGKVTAFIPTPEAESPEGVGFDDAGNVYGSWTGKMAGRRWTKG